MRLLSRNIAVASLLVFPFLASAAQPVRNWQEGTLMETEKQQVHQGSMTTSNSDFSAKKKGDKTDFSGNRTSNTTEEYDNYQVYTIKGKGTTYVAREKLLFPWSKAASVTVGTTLKYSVEKNNIYLLGEDGKQHKASISKASMDSVP